MRCECPCCRVVRPWYEFTPAGVPPTVADAETLPDRLMVTEFLPECCHVCGWSADFSRHWHQALALTVERMPQPAGMGRDEFALRKALLATWLTEPSDEYLARLQEFADFLAEQGSPEEAAARADWREYGRPADGHGRPAASGWLFRPAPGWIVETSYALPSGHVVRNRHTFPANLRPAGRQTHNARWFLGWPPGRVRVTGVNYPDPSLFRLTVHMGRSLTYSRPYEAGQPHGYPALFHPPQSLDPTPDLLSAIGIA